MFEPTPLRCTKAEGLKPQWPVVRLMYLAAKGNTNMANTDNRNTDLLPGSAVYKKEGMDKVDFQRSAELLHIVEKCAGHGPKLNALATAAMNELLDLNDKLKVVAIKAEQEAAKLRAEGEAKERAKVEAEARAQEAAAARQPRIIPTFEGPREMSTSAQADTSGDPNVRPQVYPSDSNTATIADRRL